MNRVIRLSKAASYVRCARMMKSAERVTLKIPYSEEEINDIVEMANRRARIYNRIPGFYGGMGTVLGLLGSVALTGGEPASSTLAVGALGGLGLGAFGGLKMRDWALKADEKEVNNFLKSLNRNNQRTVSIPLTGIENMRRLQDSWLQPKAQRNYWKKVLKAYDEQVGNK